MRRVKLQKLHDAYAEGAPEVDDTDGYSFEFSDWRFNIRMSNTEPVVRLNVETVEMYDPLGHFVYFELH